MIPLMLSLNTGAHVPYFSPSTGQSNFLPILTRQSTSKSTSPMSFVSTGPPTKFSLTSYRHVEVNHSSPVSCLPRWAK
jgi:hypothetical protein